MDDLRKLDQAIAKGGITGPIYAYRVDGETVSITTPYETLSVDISSPKEAEADEKKPAKAKQTAKK